jgi:hypothetical protein
MPDYSQILYAIEVHSVEGIQNYLNDGGDPNEVHDGVPLFSTMIEMYYRSPKFKDCVRAFIDAGLVFEDKALLAVLSHNATDLAACIAQDAAIVFKTYNLYKNAYTPLTGGTCCIFVPNIIVWPVPKCFYSTVLMLMPKQVWMNMVLAAIRPYSIRLTKTGTVL